MATKKIASGQITIVDLNDGKAVQAFTSSSQGDTQIYNPSTKTYTPSYASSPFQLVTAKIYVTGSSVDQAPLSSCSGWSWRVNNTEVQTTGDISYNKNVLTIKKDIDPSVRFLNIEWSCIFTDPDTLAVTTVQGYKTISLSQSGGATGIVRIQKPFGDTFDSSNSAITQLTAEATLWRGSTQDTTISDALWERLDISDGTWKEVPASMVTALSNGMSKLTVIADDVLNFQTFRCTLTDTETGEEFAEIVTFIDATDPYTVEVYSNTGDKILNGSGSTTVMARVWRDGVVVEDADTTVKQFNYTWTKYDANGATTNWSGTSSTTKTGNPITVLAADVVMRCTIYCEVTKTI